MGYEFMEGNPMTCIFCNASIGGEKLPDQWFRIRGLVFGREFVVVSCPKHRTQGIKMVKDIFAGGPIKSLSWRKQYNAN